MREQRVGLPFIVLLHCPRPRGTLCGSNNFLTSSCQMQNIPANGMGCVLVSCTAAFWFPGLCHVLSHRKASLSAGMRGPRISGADTRQRRQKTQLKCWRQPVQAGGVHLGHSCGLVCGKVVRKWAPLSCFSSACPRTAVREDLPHAFLLLPPSLSNGRSSLHAGGLPLGGLDPIATLTVLSGKFCWPHWPHPLSVQSLQVLRQDQEHVWGPVLPRGT